MALYNLSMTSCYFSTNINTLVAHTLPIRNQEVALVDEFKIPVDNKSYMKSTSVVKNLLPPQYPINYLISYNNIPF